MVYTIQEGDFVPQQPKRGREHRNTHSSNTLNETHDEQRNMNSKIKRLVEKMARKNLVSPTGSSEDDNEIN